MLHPCYRSSCSHLSYWARDEMKAAVVCASVLEYKQRTLHLLCKRTRGITWVLLRLEGTHLFLTSIHDAHNTHHQVTYLEVSLPNDVHISWRCSCC